MSDYRSIGAYVSTFQDSGGLRQNNDPESIMLVAEAPQVNVVRGDGNGADNNDGAAGHKEHSVRMAELDPRYI